MLKVLIIEDEPNSRELLRQMLEVYCEEVTVIGEAANVKTGIQLTQELQPELVFLDIKLPDGTGFDFLDAFDPIPFKTIFVTGYDQYAVLAFRYAALDYLLKPTDLDVLREAVKRARKILSPSKKTIKLLHNNLRNRPEEFEQIVLSDYKSHTIIPLAEILYLEAKGNYVIFYMENGKKRIASNPLNYYEDLFPLDRFFRIHKSFLVNLAQVKEYGPGRGGEVLLSNEQSLPIAFRRKSQFIKKIQERSSKNKKRHN